MPIKKSKPARLWLRPKRKDRDAMWVILDRGREISTGCGADEIIGAEDALTNYVGAKRSTTVGGRDLSVLSIADVLTFYTERQAPEELKLFDEKNKNELTIEQKRQLDIYLNLVTRIEKLNEWWGDKTLAGINGENCRSYAKWRTGQKLKKATKLGSVASLKKISNGTARRELEDLRAAVNAYHAEYVLPAVPVVSLPEKSQPRDVWLDRGQMARLLGASLGFVWDREKDCWAYTEEGGKRRFVRRDKVTRTRRAHYRRFILNGLMTGTRHQANQLMQWHPNTVGGWWDIEAKRFYRRGRNERETKKRRPPGRIPDRLLPHLRRWARLDKELGTRWFIHKPNGDRMTTPLRSGWDGIREDAGLDDDVLPHTLRHTGITWSMQKGIDPAQVSQLYAITLEELQRTYWHHHPDYQEGVAKAFSRREK